MSGCFRLCSAPAKAATRPSMIPVSHLTSHWCVSSVAWRTPRTCSKSLFMWPPTNGAVTGTDYHRHMDCVRPLGGAIVEVIAKVIGVILDNEVGFACVPYLPNGPSIRARGDVVPERQKMLSATQILTRTHLTHRCPVPFLCGLPTRVRERRPALLPGQMIAGAPRRSIFT